MRRFIPVLVLAVLLAGPAFADEWTKTYDVGSAPSLDLSTHDASIFVTGEAGGGIQVTITTKGIDIGENGLQIKEEQSGDSVSLELKPASKKSWWNISYQAEVEVRVPRNTKLSLHTGDGNIDVRSLAADVRLATGDGDISVKDLDGNLRVSTGDGDIRTEAVNGSIEASTGDGDVEAGGRFAGVEIRTGDGDVELTAQKGSRVDGPWSVRTGDGRVTLYLPGDLPADVDLHTGDGRIDLGLPVNVSGRTDDRIQGTINGGGQMLQVRTGDGSITLKPLS